MNKKPPHPEPLVETEWLNNNLDNDRVRIIDVTATLKAQPVGASRVEGGREQWEESHIPGSTYLHLIEDLSAPEGALPYNLPSVEHMTALMSGISVDDDTIVILYGGSYFPAVTRAWWVLAASGVKDVRILNGGWKKWKAESRPVSSETPSLHKGTFRASRIDALIASKQDVLEAIDDEHTVLVNALSKEQFMGSAGTHYGRPGRIPGSVSVPTRDLYGNYSSMLAPKDRLEQLMAAHGVLDADRVIAYCGGGIAASTTVFVLTLLGHQAVSLYDKSLLEWSNLSECPMVIG